MTGHLSILDQTAEATAGNMMVIGGSTMSDASAYVVFERNAWSILRQCEMHFRLTYERVFLPAQNLWRDFLVNCEEIGVVLPFPNHSAATYETSRGETYNR